MDLDTMRARVRLDLRDPDAERWDDATLDRHIERALAEVSLAAPREVTATLATGADSRDLDLAALAGRIAVDAVEYPVGHYPPAFVPFSIWGDTLTLEVDALPEEGEEVHVRYSAAYAPTRRGRRSPTRCTTSSRRGPRHMRRSSGPPTPRTASTSGATTCGGATSRGGRTASPRSRAPSRSTGGSAG